MRRKAGAGRPAPEVGRMTPARAWKTAIPRAAEDTLAVIVSVLRVEEERVVRDSLPGLIGQQALITVLEGPEERFGVAIIDATVLAAVIEAATTGRIGSRPVVPREPTRTDATIAADLLDAVLDGFETHLSEMDEAPNLAGYRYAAPMVDARAMTITLADGPYSVFRLQLDLGGGLRQGEIIAAFPVAPRGVGSGRDIAAFQQALADNVMGAPAELDATLYRMQMPLSEVSQLRPDDILRVPLAALGLVDVGATGGPLVARARLGQQGGFRALRIVRVEGDPVHAPDAADFEEAAPASAPAALPPGGYGLGTRMAAGVRAGEDLPDLPPLDDLPAADFDDLPFLGDDGDDGDLADLGDAEGGGLLDLPSLDGEDDRALPGLPPLSG
jgi:flagellar motor switch protein FliM